MPRSLRAAALLEGRAAFYSARQAAPKNRMASGVFARPVLVTTGRMPRMFGTGNGVLARGLARRIRARCVRGVSGEGAFFGCNFGTLRPGAALGQSGARFFSG